MQGVNSREKGRGAGRRRDLSTKLVNDAAVGWD